MPALKDRKKYTMVVTFYVDEDELAKAREIVRVRQRLADSIKFWTPDDVHFAEGEGVAEFGETLGVWAPDEHFVLPQ